VTSNRRIDRWEAALANYLVHRPTVSGSLMRAANELRIDTSRYVRAAHQEHDGSDDRCAVAVTVAQAESTTSTYVVMPLIQFIAIQQPSNLRSAP
jgi:cell wall assembly regulator SMI1